jgi:NADH-quinone oxidoreductase subunit J
MTPNDFIFAVLALAVVVTAIGMLVSRNAVYSALFLVLNFSIVAILYLILGAPFIAMAQVTVYAGAIMVLFLFVIMLLGGERLPGGEPLRFQRPATIILALLLGAEAMVFILFQGWTAPLPDAVSSFADPEAIGRMMFGKFSLPFEVTSVILLVAVVGAILLTRVDKINPRPSLRDSKKE